MSGQPHIPPLLVQTQSLVAAEWVEHMTHVQEGLGSSLGSAGAGWSGEVVRLPGLVGSEDVLGMFQVVLR
jgi:hypothetical protein